MPDQMTPDEAGFESVCYSTTDDGLPFAYRRGQVITTQLRRALALLSRLDEPGGAAAEQESEGLAYQKIDAWPGEERDNLDPDRPTMGAGQSRVLAPPKWHGPGEEPPDPNRPSDDPEAEGPFFLVRGIRDPLRAVMELQVHGIVAQLNYVYFAHGPGSAWSQPQGGLTASPVYASPVYASPVYASPVYASPVYASPVYASPVYASPVYASPAAASPVASTDAVPRTSSATPAEEGHTTDAVWKLLHEPARHGARVFVLDTGLADPTYLASSLAAVLDAPHPIRPLRPSDATDRPEAGTHFLAPAAGHGTFIAGLISQVAPGCRISVGKVLDNSGIGDEWRIARRIHALTTRLAEHPDPVGRQSVLSLSFGAPVLDHPHLLAHVVSAIQAEGVVVVASAGNDAMSRPVFPAALPGVVGVGALSPAGPAPFSNFGPWVNACAPGVDLVGIFFNWSEHPEHFRFRGWAIWSGTSFAGPIVAGAIARLTMTAPILFNRTIPTAEARRRLIDPAWLLRIPDLGTVVNLL